ncbi:MAG TPA: hemolysin family protein [Anaerolineales bacterium]|nr:hemolysin family protein [Anaerolineales bacterium]
MTPETVSFGLALLAALGLDGLLSAVRAALMNSHATALREWEAQGTPGAARALALASDASRLLLSFGAVQYLARLLAVAMAVGLGLAWGASVGLLLAAVVMAGLAAALAEMVGEALALRSPDRIACRLGWLGTAAVGLASPARAVHRWLTRPGPGRRTILPPLVTEEQIKTIVDAGEEGGAIEVDEKQMILSIFELSETLVREVMVPRIDICAFDERQSLEQVADGLLQAGHSRAPVFRGDIDRVIGMVYVRDLLQAFRQGRRDDAVSSLLRPALFVPEAKKADDLLTELQARRIHMAVVVDEYGGTAGLVTLEDLVEEIVGEIRDEYDAGEEAAAQELRGGEFLFSGRIDLDEVNQLTGGRLSKDISETLGGYISGRLGRVPASGDVIDAGGLHLVVEQSSGRRILKVRASRMPESQEADEA